MTKRIWTGTCAALVGFAAAAAISAQTTAPPQTTTAPPPQSTTASADKVTVTGCLKQESAKTTEPSAAATTAGSTAGAPPATTGAPGATADATTAQKFVLTEASKSSGEAAAATSSATGTAGSTAPVATDSAKPAGSETYHLIANPAALSPHLGKKLELTGTLVDNPDASPAASSTTASNSGSKALRVESGKVIAASCTP
jgi:hypothetical protein